MWLESAWSCLVLVRNDQKHTFKTQAVPAIALDIEPEHHGSSNILLGTYLGHPGYNKPIWILHFSGKMDYSSLPPTISCFIRSSYNDISLRLQISYHALYIALINDFDVIWIWRGNQRLSCINETVNMFDIFNGGYQLQLSKQIFKFRADPPHKSGHLFCSQLSFFRHCPEPRY